jgi:hypothetical protein
MYMLTEPLWSPVDRDSRSTALAESCARRGRKNGSPSMIVTSSSRAISASMNIARAWIAAIVFLRITGGRSMPRSGVLASLTWPAATDPSAVLRMLRHMVRSGVLLMVRRQRMHRNIVRQRRITVRRAELERLHRTRLHHTLRRVIPELRRDRVALPHMHRRVARIRPQALRVPLPAHRTHRLAARIRRRAAGMLLPRDIPAERAKQRTNRFTSARSISVTSRGSIRRRFWSAFAV